MLFKPLLLAILVLTQGAKLPSSGAYLMYVSTEEARATQKWRKRAAHKQIADH